MTTSIEGAAPPPDAAPAGRRALRAIVLAAGKQGTAPNGQPMVFQKLDGRTVLDYVLENARAAVPPDRIYIVVGSGGELPSR